MPDTDDLALMTATELLPLFRAGAVSPVESTRAILNRIERYNDAVNAYNLVDPEGALDAARRSEERYRIGQPLGLLDGITVAIKDIFLSRGWPTLRGSALVDPDQPWEIDAPTVAALRRHGAIFAGKTTTPELGWKGVTDSPLSGVTRNPWDTAKTAGGSSGGSGAAVALGMATLALGTDGGGSIRIPASFCGTTGIKPTYGRIPHWPASPYDTLAHAGPMGWSIADCTLMLAVLMEPDARDWTALPPSAAPPLDQLEAGIAGLRVAVSTTLGFAPTDPEVAAATLAAGRVFEDLGANVEEVDPGFDDPVELWETIWYAGAARAADGYTDEDLQRMDPGLAGIIQDGRSRSAVDYVKAVTARRDLGAHMNRFHQQYDLLIAPSVGVLPFEAGRDVPEDWPDSRWISWAGHLYPFNLTQQPTVAVPCGFSESGLPIGIQVVAGKYRDDLAIRGAYAYQAARPLTHLRPAL